MYGFGEFRLDPQRRLLFRGQERVPLTGKAFDVLHLLIECGDRVVSREELLRTVWPETAVEESNLTQTVFMVRKALGQGAGDGYIVTVQGKGYRFAVPVTRLAPEPPPTPRKGRLVLAAAGLGVLLLGLAALAYSRREAAVAPPASPRARTMLAVLPFRNLTGDTGQEYFSDGMTEEMITQLGKIGPHSLGVIARASVMRYKSSDAPLEQIGRELGVDYVLEGSVRRDAKKVRISARLIEVDDQTHRWTRDYDRELQGVLALQRDIAQDIAAEIQLALDEDRGALTAREARLPPASYAAYDATLKGRYHWNKRTAEGFQEAIRHFEQAVRLDPREARAHAGLADCYALMPGYAMTPQAESMTKSHASALRAIELNERLAEAHTSLALVLVNFHWDWAAAERAYLRAIELNPSYATAHHWYAELLLWQGRFEEAMRESEVAQQLDPLSLIIVADAGMILYCARRFDEAERKLASVLELEPDFPRAHLIRNVWVEKGEFDRALADIDGFSPHTTPWDRAYVLGRAGRFAEADRALAELERFGRDHPVDPAAMAWALVARDKEKALDWLEKAHVARSQLLISLKVDPAWDALRQDPRFQELLRKVGLGDAVRPVRE